MKDILTSKLRRQRDFFISMVNACCEEKFLQTDNIISMCQSFEFFIGLLFERHVNLDRDLVRLYAFNQGDLDELS